MRVLVTGLAGHYAFGGVFWDYMQYVMGFKALGHDVWYLEDTGAWAYHPILQEPSADCSHNVAYLQRVMEEFEMGDRWIYRNEADGKFHGSETGRAANMVIEGADLLINVSGACWLRPETSRIKEKLFLDGDPMFTQIGMVTDERTGSHIRAHDHHFSFGLGIGQPGCRVPEGGIHWKPTVQPIALEHWDMVGEKGHVAEEAWTTVMNWSSYSPKKFEGEAYGQKDEEFLRFLDLPGKTRERFVLGMGQGVGKSRPTKRLQDLGWQIVEPDEQLPDFRAYRSFLASSKAEWSVAKSGYVKSRSGWFSCRSACYLALGKPVVVQDTGWSNYLPSTEGVLAFNTLDEAVTAIRNVSENYEHHSRAAKAYAKKYFDAKNVCSQLLEQI